MKPKKGEAHAEMDELLKNPLQLVKELVLLIVEARTPDLSVKGRVEGPHCPIIRGRLVHKCSAEKAECVRASEFCYLAQRLWSNSVPICLDILLFPNCIHGQEEASVTEGTVTTVSQENALLAERWTIDGSKRRQDDCLSSSMLIQAVRSYLHFSQISSWLYSTGGKLPGFLAYRVYAPGEVTSLDFLQTPDIHHFPVCQASFDHIRVTVSSLQRQANVPILVCLQEKAMGNNSREAHFRGNGTQKSKSKKVKVSTINEDLKDCSLSENSVKGSDWVTGVWEQAYVPAAGYNTPKKSSKKYVKTLPEASAQVLSEEEMYGPSDYLTDLFTSNRSSRIGNISSGYKETSSRHTLSDADISRMKAKNMTRLMTSDGGDHDHLSANALYATRNCIAYEDENSETSLNAHMNPDLDVVTFTPDLLGRRMKPPSLKIGQSLQNQVVSRGTSFKSNSPYFDIFQDEAYSGLDRLSREKKRQEKDIKKDRLKHLCLNQLKVGLKMNAQEQKLDNHIGTEEEYNKTDEAVDVQTLIRNKKKAEFSKFKKSLDERQPGSIPSLKVRQFQNDGMKELSQDLLGNSDVHNIDGLKLCFPVSPNEKFHESSSVHSRDKSALFNKISSGNKLMATKENNISYHEANEELIRRLSDRMSMITMPQNEMFASPKFSAKFQDTEVFSDHASMLKNLVQGRSQINKTLPLTSDTRDPDADGLDADIEELTKRSVKNSKLIQLTFDVTKSPDILEDSDDTPVASPTQTPRLKLMSESLMKSVTEKSIKHNCQWLQRDQSKPLDYETVHDTTDHSNISPSDFQVANNSPCVAHGTMKEQGLDAALKRIQPLTKNNLEPVSEPYTSIPGFHQQLVAISKAHMQQTEQKTNYQPINIFAQGNLYGNVNSPSEVVKSNKALHETTLESNDPLLSDNEKYLNENININENHISEDCFISTQDLPRPCSRRFFEENLLPLVSYDADSDSFRKVEELYNSDILHSPKVLFSCDVPSTMVSNSKKCIDFGDTFEDDFFRSKISDLMGPEAIGKYMSNLATLSSSITNGKEDHDEDTFGRIKQVDDLVRQDRLSNNMSSKSDCLFKHHREENNIQTNADFQSTRDCCFIKTQNDNDSVLKEKRDKELQGYCEVAKENLKESLVNNSTFNQTRRQLNLSFSENAKSATIKKNKECVDETLLSANVSLLASLVSSEERTLPGITSSKDIADSSPSVRRASSSPPLSSSYSSSTSSSSTSSSSTSSIRMVSGSLSPTSPAALQETFSIDKSSKSDNFLLDIQEPQSTCSSGITTDQEDENTTVFLAETKMYNQSQVQTDLKSNLRSSNNTESHAFTTSDVTFPVPSTPISSSFHSPSISAYTSSMPQSLPILIDATHEHLCHNDSPTSLSKVIIPHPVPHDDVDFDHSKSEPGAGSSFEYQPSLPGSLCNHKNQTHNLDSQMVSDSEIPEHVPNLFPDQPQVTHFFDAESIVSNHGDRMSTVRKGSIASCAPVFETASHKMAVSHAQTIVKSFLKGDTTMADSVSPSITTQSTLDLLPDKTLPKIESVETFENQSNFSKKEFNADNFLVTCNNCTTVIPDLIDASKDNHESKSETSEIVYIDDIYGSKQRDKYRHDCSSSIFSVPTRDDHELSCSKRDIDSLGKVTLTCSSRNSSETTRFLAATVHEDISVLCEDLSVLQEQSQLYLQTKDNDSSHEDLDNDSRTRFQNGERFEKNFHPSCVEWKADFCTFGIDQEASESSEIEKNREAYLKNDHFIDFKIDSTHQQHSSIKIIQTGEDSKNGFEVEDEGADKDKCIDVSDWNNDVVFYLSETESKMRANPTLSLLSNSLQENVTPSVNYKVTRPSSLSAEINLEMRLRTNPGVINKSNLDLSDHSGSPPYHADPPGWSSVPPHRTVSTPSCMDRETKSQDERISSDLSVIQQHNCDHVVQTGLRKMAARSASMIFNNRTGLPTQSSPAPLKRKSGGRFDYDVSLLNTRAIKNAFSCSKLASNIGDGDGEEEETKRTLSTSAPASTNCLLGNFEESILNGRIDPVGTVDGFTAEIGASGSFCPKHLHLPVSAFFFALSDDNAPSPYLGHINLESVGKKGYHIPKQGTVQVTLFNPNKTVVKMFVVVYDLSDMPASSQTFIRQRTVYSPIDKNQTAPSYLRYLIHLRCASSHSRKIYLHTDIRLIFARHKLDIDAKTIPYELKSYTEGPQNPKYSPKK